MRVEVTSQVQAMLKMKAREARTKLLKARTKDSTMTPAEMGTLVEVLMKGR